MSSFYLSLYFFVLNRSLESIFRIQMLNGLDLYDEEIRKFRKKEKDLE